MPRRRRRARWQKVITKLLVAAISDVRRDLKTGHAHAVKARTADVSRRQGVTVGTDNTAYSPIYGTPPPAAKPSSRRRPASRSVTRPADAFYGQSGFPVNGHLELISQEEYNRLPVQKRQERLRATGHCGAKTQDGSPCLNPAGCSIPAHRRQRKAK